MLPLLRRSRAAPVFHLWQKRTISTRTWHSLPMHRNAGDLWPPPPSVDFFHVSRACRATRARWYTRTTAGDDSANALPGSSSSVPTPNTSASTKAPPSSSRLDEEGLLVSISNDEAEQMIARAKQVWPCPPVVPPGWSCAWESWPYLYTFFWFSPYFLMLPQIEMLVNIRYAIPGEVRPILFSPEKEAFMFVVNGKYYMYDCKDLEMHAFVEEWTEEGLVNAMYDASGDLDALEMMKVEEDPEGKVVLQRILDRDETVTQVLGEKYLDYTPDVTELSEERYGLLLQPEQEANEEEAEREMERLAEDVERKLLRPNSETGS